jgi:hypothetical protein
MRSNLDRRLIKSNTRTLRAHAAVSSRAADLGIGKGDGQTRARSIETVRRGDCQWAKIGAPLTLMTSLGVLSPHAAQSIALAFMAPLHRGAASPSLFYGAWFICRGRSFLLSLCC